MSAIHLLLIHCLHNGLLANSNSVQEALDNIAFRGDKVLQWAQPQAPVILFLGVKEERNAMGYWT